MLSTGLLTERGVENLVSRDAVVGHSLLTTQHPDDHVRHAVLGLNTVNVRTSVTSPTSVQEDLLPTDKVRQHSFDFWATVFFLYWYLLSQCFQFVCPGLDVGQRVADLSGLLSHASGSSLNGFQAIVSQLLDLDVQRCQVGAALQLRSWVAEGDPRLALDNDLSKF